MRRAALALATCTLVDALQLHHKTVRRRDVSQNALRLDQRAVDEVQPLVADLAAALSRVAAPCPGGRASLERWLVALNGMRAAEEIDDAQARQLAFDLDAAYAEFHRGLKDAS